MKREIKIASLLCSVLLGIILMYPSQFLTLRSNEDIVWMFHAEHDSTFSLRWIHSVEKEEWEEFFRIKNNVIYLYETRFKTFGAGVPDDVGTDSYIKDGWVYMVGIDREIGDFHVRAGSTTNHRFYWRDQAYQLSKEHEEKPYHLKVERMPRFQIIKYQLSTLFKEVIQNGSK